MFTKVMTIVLASIISGVLYIAGYYNGFQKGLAEGEEQCRIEQQRQADGVVEVMANYIIYKESSNKPGKWGDLDRPHPTYGKAQFQKRTFYWMAKMAGLKNPDWKNEEQQVWLLKWALKNGYGSHWGKNYRQARSIAERSVEARHILRVRI